MSPLGYRWELYFYIVCARAQAVALTRRVPGRMSVLLHSLARIICGLGRTHSEWLVQLFLESLLPGKSPRLRVYWRVHTEEDQSARAGARERNSVKRAAQTNAPPQKPFLGKRFPVLFFPPKAAEHFTRPWSSWGKTLSACCLTPKTWARAESARRFVAITLLEDVGSHFVCIFKALKRNHHLQSI